MFLSLGCGFQAAADFVPVHLGASRSSNKTQASGCGLAFARSKAFAPLVATRIIRSSFRIERTICRRFAGASSTSQYEFFSVRFSHFFTCSQFTPSSFAISSNFKRALSKLNSGLCLRRGHEPSTCHKRPQKALSREQAFGCVAVTRL